MTKKNTIWDGILYNDEPSLAKRIGVATLAWIGVFLFGLGSLIGLLTIAGLLTDMSEGRQAIRLWLVYSIFAVLFVGASVRYAKRRRTSLFFGYAISPLQLGVVINVIIFLVALVSAIVSLVYSSENTNNASDNGNTVSCRPLKDQISKIQQATVPIATEIATGTAFAVQDGYTLLTAYHVVEGAKKVYANYADGEVSVKVVAAAPELDLALLRISEPQTDYLELSSTYQVGDAVYSNGFPGNTFDAGQASLAGGIVSRYLSNDDLRMNYEDTPKGLAMIQTDAAINPGNSGGALVAECGVIGIVVSVSSSDSSLRRYGIRSEEGIGFAVSAETAAKRFNLHIH